MFSIQSDSVNIMKYIAHGSKNDCKFTLEQSFETCATFRPVSASSYRQPPMSDQDMFQNSAPKLVA